VKRRNKKNGMKHKMTLKKKERARRDKGEENQRQGKRKQPKSCQHKGIRNEMGGAGGVVNRKRGLD